MIIYLFPKISPGEHWLTERNMEKDLKIFKEQKPYEIWSQTTVELNQRSTAERWQEELEIKQYTSK